MPLLLPVIFIPILPSLVTVSLLTVIPVWALVPALIPVASLILILVSVLGQILLSAPEVIVVWGLILILVSWLSSVSVRTGTKTDPGVAVSISTHTNTDRWVIYYILALVLMPALVLIQECILVANSISILELTSAPIPRMLGMSHACTEVGMGAIKNIRMSTDITTHTNLAGMGGWHCCRY